MYTITFPDKGQGEGVLVQSNGTQVPVEVQTIKIGGARVMTVKMCEPKVKKRAGGRRLPLTVNVRERVKDYMKANGLSSYAMSHKCGVAVNSIHALDNSEYIMTDTLAKIEEVIG